MNDNAMIVILTLALSLAFCGEPDLHDAVIKNLMQQECKTTEKAQ